MSGAQWRRQVKARKMAEGTWTERAPKTKVEREATKKRIREESKTPEHPSKHRSGSTRPSVQYNEIANNLRMAIIDSKHPDIVLDQEQADQIQNRLLRELDGTPSGSGNPIQFLKTTFSGGVQGVRL